MLGGCPEEGSISVVVFSLTGRASPHLHNGVLHVGDENTYVSLLLLRFSSSSISILIFFVARLCRNGECWQGARWASWCTRVTANRRADNRALVWRPRISRSGSPFATAIMASCSIRTASCSEITTRSDGKKKRRRKRRRKRSQRRIRSFLNSFLLFFFFSLFFDEGSRFNTSLAAEATPFWRWTPGQLPEMIRSWRGRARNARTWAQLLWRNSFVPSE